MVKFLEVIGTTILIFGSLAIMVVILIICWDMLFPRCVICGGTRKSHTKYSLHSFESAYPEWVSYGED